MPTITKSGRKPMIGFVAAGACSKKLKSIILSDSKHQPYQPTIQRERNIVTDYDGDQVSLFYRCAADTVQKFPKSPKQYRLPDLSHQVKVVGQIMQSGERGE